MTKLPAYLLWNQALNLMVTGEPRDCSPRVVDMEQVWAASCNEPPPVHCMTFDRARAELLDRLATGAAIAVGQKRQAIGLNGYRTESLPSPIEPTAWINLKIDDAISDATILPPDASIPGQGYTKVRLRSEDILAAREAVLAEHSAERTEPRNKGGSPGRAYSEDAIAAATNWLLDEGGECDRDVILKTVRFIENWVAENSDDGGPWSPNTYKSWARRALKRCLEAKS